MKTIIILEKFVKKRFFTCPKTGKITRYKKKAKNAKWIFIVAGFFCLLWFLIRVIPKPDRALYPCQRLSAPYAFGFTAWLVSMAGTGLSSLKSKISFRYSRFFTWGTFIIVILAVCIPLNFTGSQTLLGYQPFEKPNAPIGEAKGINPGRVVWVQDKDATRFSGDGFWWQENNTDQDTVNEMMSKSIQWLAGESENKAAWDKIFKYFNRIKNDSDSGYRKGEKIVIKVNLNQDDGKDWENQHMPSPQVVHSLVSQLINVVGVKGEDITIADPSRHIGDPLYNKIHQDLNPQFQAVKFVGQNRTFPIEDNSHPIYFSGSDLPDAEVPAVYVEAKYLINLALFRAHTIFGVTLCGKNHFGSVYFSGLGFSPLPLHKSQWSTYGNYHCIVDLIGHDELGGKTVLYIIDGLYHSSNESDKTIDRFSSFDNGWASSIFVSQDPVAIDSVALDFLANEPDINIDGSSGCPDNYLIEAALAGNPPSNTFYDPNRNGGIGSLGVHEHWNNPADKEYSKNLGFDHGIELISQDPAQLISKTVEYAEPDGGQINQQPQAEEEILSETPDTQSGTQDSAQDSGNNDASKGNNSRSIGGIARKTAEKIFQYFIDLWILVHTLLDN